MEKQSYDGINSLTGKLSSGHNYSTFLGIPRHCLQYTFQTGQWFSGSKVYIRKDKRACGTLEANSIQKSLNLNL